MYLTVRKYNQKDYIRYLERRIGTVWEARTRRASTNKSENNIFFKNATQNTEKSPIVFLQKNELFIKLSVILPPKPNY